MAELPTVIVEPAAVASAAGLGGVDKETKAAAAIAEARARLEEALADRFREPAAAIYGGMVTTVAVAIAQRHRAPGNAQTTTVEDGTVVRPSVDPLAGVRRDLARYVVGLA